MSLKQWKVNENEELDFYSLASNENALNWILVCFITAWILFNYILDFVFIRRSLNFLSYVDQWFKRSSLAIFRFIVESEMFQTTPMDKSPRLFVCIKDCVGGCLNKCQTIQRRWTMPDHRKSHCGGAKLWNLINQNHLGSASSLHYSNSRIHDRLIV